MSKVQIQDNSQPQPPAPAPSSSPRPPANFPKCGFKRKTCQNFRSKLSVKTFGQNVSVKTFRSKLSVKTFGQNFRSKLIGTQTLNNFYKLPKPYTPKPRDPLKETLSIPCGLPFKGPLNLPLNHQTLLCCRFLVIINLNMECIGTPPKKVGFGRFR